MSKSRDSQPWLKLMSIGCLGAPLAALLVGVFVFQFRNSGELAGVFFITLYLNLPLLTITLLLTRKFQWSMKVISVLLVSVLSIVVAIAMEMEAIPQRELVLLCTYGPEDGNERLERIEKLLQEGVSPDVDHGGYPALCFAAKAGNVDTLNILLKYGAWIDAHRLVGGGNALHIAAIQWICRVRKSSS